MIFDELAIYKLIIKCNESSSEHKIKSETRQILSKYNHGEDIQ